MTTTTKDYENNYDESIIGSPFYSEYSTLLHHETKMQDVHYHRREAIKNLENIQFYFKKEGDFVKWVNGVVKDLVKYNYDIECHVGDELLSLYKSKYTRPNNYGFDMVRNDILLQSDTRKRFKVKCYSSSYLLRIPMKYFTATIVRVNYKNTENKDRVYLIYSNPDSIYLEFEIQDCSEICEIGITSHSNSFTMDEGEREEKIV